MGEVARGRLAALKVTTPVTSQRAGKLLEDAMHTFLVIGLYVEDDNQRWADSFEARTAEEAEGMAPSDVTVAGVVQLIKGEMVVVA